MLTEKWRVEWSSSWCSRQPTAWWSAWNIPQSIKKRGTKKRPIKWSTHLWLGCMGVNSYPGMTWIYTELFKEPKVLTDITINFSSTKHCVHLCLNWSDPIEGSGRGRADGQTGCAQCGGGAGSSSIKLKLRRSGYNGSPAPTSLS